MTTEAASTPATPQVLSSQRVFPATPPPTAPVTTALSIADAITARFSICGAIWFYDASPATQGGTTFLVARLQQSLSETLDDYRHFAGQLRWSTKEDISILPSPQTLGRPLITYNAPTDPGVEFTHASDARTLASLVPSSEERTGSKKVWRATDFKQDELLPACPLAFHPDPDTFDGLPGVSAQLTVFACGGWALGVRMTHCLGDAVCLVAFVKAWAARAQLLLLSKTSSSEDNSISSTTTTTITTNPTACLFAPALLDRHAGVSATEPPDDAKIAFARSLPIHRFDWWDADAPAIPAWARSAALATRPDARALAGVTLSPATAPPWASWDAGAAVEHVQIRITADEVRRLREAAAATTGSAAAAAAQGPVVVLSRLDALVAHFWMAVNRARGLLREEEVEEEVFLNVSLGLRGRVSPPLPDSFAGSPLLLGHVGRTGAELCSASLGSVALEVRRMMARFTPEAVGAYLHDAAHEVSPQRLWQAFLGTRHTGVTSWTKSGVWEVDFGAGRVRYVQARMPRLDGQLQVMDLGETGDHEVSLCLEKEAMERLLGDERLWAWGADGS